MRREITAEADGVRLAGSAWIPDGADVGVLMHPGSGPSDRDNDVFFPPIREHLLAAGIAVCSFDKRGVGGSSGRWEEAGIVEQAADLLAGLAASRASGLEDLPIGLFGHSQGGWVVVEAAAREPGIAFVIASSGGGASPARQERYSLTQRTSSAEALAAYDAVIALMHERPSFDEGLHWLGESGVDRNHFGELQAMFEDEAIWRLVVEITNYDPAGALARITCPVLAVVGADDPINPPEESVAAFRSSVRPELLEIAAFPGGGHRLGFPDFVDGYLERLVEFVRSVAR